MSVVKMSVGFCSGVGSQEGDFLLISRACLKTLTLRYIFLSASGLVVTQKGVSSGIGLKSPQRSVQSFKGEGLQEGADLDLGATTGLELVARGESGRGLEHKASKESKVRRHESLEVKEADALPVEELEGGEGQKGAVGEKRKKQNPIKKKVVRPNCVLGVDIGVDEVMEASETILVGRDCGRKYSAAYIWEWVHSEWGTSPGKPVKIKILDRGWFSVRFHILICNFSKNIICSWSGTKMS